jgi:hypothetical protein
MLVDRFRDAQSKKIEILNKNEGVQKKKSPNAFTIMILPQKCIKLKQSTNKSSSKTTRTIVSSNKCISKFRFEASINKFFCLFHGQIHVPIKTRQHAFFQSQNKQQNKQCHLDIQHPNSISPPLDGHTQP